VEELCCGRIVHGRIVRGRIVRGRIVALPSESSLDDFEDQVDDMSDYIEGDMDDGEPDIPLI
jgi:hypothetical protein